jgi:membrane-associated phospholipid phosphatase
LLVLVYFGIRALTEGRVDRAFANAESLLRLERAAGVAWETEVQALIEGQGELVAIANWIYIYGHWPVILVSAAVLYARARRRYVLLRNAMIVSGLIGFLFFALLPMAPPRFAMPELIDTVTQYSHGYRALQPPTLTNQYAAMPSLHVGWNLLVAVAVFGATSRRAVRLFAIVMPVAMAFAAVATANHFILDLVAGTLVVLVALALSIRLQPSTLDERGTQAGNDALVAASPVRHRPPLRQLPRRPADSGGARSARDRGRRTPLPRTARGAPPEDARPAADPLGSLEAREPVRRSAPAR